MTASAIEQRYGPVIARCKSSREPGKIYEVRKAAAGSYSCNCRGWAIRKDCKHTKAAELTEGRSGIVDLAAEGRTVIQRFVDPTNALRRGLNRAEGQIVNAGEQAMKDEAERIVQAALTKKRQQRIAQTMPADPIRREAVRIAQLFSSWGPLPLKIDNFVNVIEDGIRKFAGSAPAAVMARPAAPAELGVRMIILED